MELNNTTNKSPNYSQNLNIWTKRIPLYKNTKYCLNDAELESELQNIASKYGFAPKIIDTRFDTDFYYIDMVNLKTDCLANVYGEKASDINEKQWNQIRYIVQTLYEQEGIAYTDITPYNFIEIKGKMYIIDFGHATYTKTLNNDQFWFLKDFLYGSQLNIYNPDFA
jgi:hypothetical protein